MCKKFIIFKIDYVSASKNKGPNTFIIFFVVFLRGKHFTKG